MIPILFEGNVQNFTNNGLGRLSDTISCVVEEERNGIFELEMTYPITGIHYADIRENRIILAKTEDGGNGQAFIIYKISRPINGIVTINAEHISYLLNGFIAMPYTAPSLAGALTAINSHAVPETPFTFQTSLTSNVPFTLSEPRNIRNLLGGENGSILDVYGGYDYKFDNFMVTLMESRGADNGVTIRYGKNLTDLKSVIDMTSVYTGIVPYWTSENETVCLDEKVVYSEHADDYPYKIIKTVDFSSDFEEKPTQAQLRARAQSYINSNDGWRIKNTVDVSFISLAQTEEYKDIAPLERVKLCDIVTIIYTELGVNIRTKVIKTVYNVLLEKYDEITLGDTTYSFSKVIQETLDVPTVSEVTSYTKAIVDHATELITGGLGGYVVMGTNANGEPQEILIMDKPVKEQATNVIRLNKNGIGFSNNGYSGTYRNAWTIDGNLVADFITTGNLRAGLLTTGIIQDRSATNYWNLDTGAFKLTAGATIGNKTLGTFVDDEAANVAGNTLGLWISNTYSQDIQAINNSIDGKAETWYQSTNPATAWATPEEKEKHRGDLWYDTTSGKTYYYKYNSSTQTYAWVQQNIPNEVFDEIDGKAQVFLRTPMPPYAVGDIWFKGTTGGIYNCVNARATGNYVASDWQVENNYIDQSAITTYDNSLDQQAVFNKLTQNGSKQGIYLDGQTGDLYINGSYIQANTISTEALTVEAKKEFITTHEFIPDNALTDISLWEYGAKAPTTETIDGKTYLVLDGTEINTFNTNYYVKIATDAMGEINPHYYVKFHVDRNTSVEGRQNFIFYNYIDPSGEGHQDHKYFAGGSVLPETDYIWDRVWGSVLNVDYTKQKGKFGIYFIQGCKTYIEILSLYTEETKYSTAAFKFNGDGLSSTVRTGNVISSINQSAEQVSINANKIDLSGDLDLHGKFTTDRSTVEDLEGFYSEYSAGGIIFYNPDGHPVASLEPTLSTSGVGEYTLTLTHWETPTTGSFIGIGEKTILHDLTILGDIDIPYKVGHKMEVSIEAQFNNYVYNQTGSVVFVSDRNKKQNIKRLKSSKSKSFIMALKPCEFEYISDNSKVSRKHHGFIAQEVKEVMKEDWGLYVENKDNGFIGLSYDELLADMITVIQDQEKRIETLGRRLNDNTNDKS